MKHLKTGLPIQPDNTILWSDISKWFDTAEEYYAFCGWLRGQTTTPNGVYVWDFDKYISGNRAITD